MLTDHLPPDLESTITEQARQNGVTPEALTLKGLREQFLAEFPKPAASTKIVENSTRSEAADFLLSMAAMFESGTGDTSEEPRALIAAAIDRKHGR